jgi:CO/xanthine dehydrogenase Mo-binding subunit/aerobic-type carbon monoxide dehydrogenase small subunit (CoxS/CutS family)
MSQTVPIVINGTAREISGSLDRRLLWVIRDDLGLSGTKYSCLEGICGACTVLVDDRPVRACVTSLGEVGGATVTTVEGLASGDELHPIQRAFIDERAFQCGFCTPGQILNAAGLLAEDPHPDDAAIRSAMDGNICRCGAYAGILRAVGRVARGDEPVADASPGSSHPGPGEPWPRPARPWDLVGPAEREYFDLLGDGLVVVVPPEPGRFGMPNGGAWLHVGPTGTVTAFTGKVDVGQDNRTALSRLVARELRVPLDSVQLVMGDTDVCPFDLGTFGSLSMPNAGPLVRAAAAGARETLVEIAAMRWQADPRNLTLEDGRIRRSDGDESVAYGELVRGLRRIQAASAQPPAETSDEAVGRAERDPGAARATARAIVTGRHRYVLDVRRPGMWFGLVLRPPSIGAALETVDLAAARATDDAVVVEEAGFVGVAAPNLRAARAALAAIRAEWRPAEVPPLEDLPGYLRAHPVEVRGWGGAIPEDDSDANSGEVDAALAASARRLEATYTAAYLAHVPLETRDAVAEWDGGRVTVWTGTQRPFGVRRELAEALGVAETEVRVLVPDTGGGFGGKHSGEVAVEAARLARAARHPVRVRWTREEEMTQAYFRPYAVIDVRAGLAADGGLAAWDFRNVNSGPNAIYTPYRVPNRRIRFQPAASPLRSGSYRALAATANAFARESAMDELASAAGADPLAFRLAHVADDRLATVLRAAAERAGWPGPRHGRRLGIAGCVEKDARVATVAEVSVDADRRLTIERLVTAFECGAIVDPGNLRNQIEGATAMGLGGALFEAVRYEAGRITTRNLESYRVPRMRDIPPIDVVLLDRPDLPSSGAGETPITTVAPAIANAVCAATGTRLRSLPLVPDGRVAAGPDGTAAATASA